MRINGILVAIAITFSLLLAIVSCGGGSSDSNNNNITGGQTGPGPRILSLNPNPVKPGDVITITGANFGASTASVLVKFQVKPQSGNGPQYVTGVIKSRTETEIKAVVPELAVDGVILIVVDDGTSVTTSIADGSAKIIIGTSTGATEPVIVSLQPDTGKVYDEIVLNGFNFGTFASGVTKIVFSHYDPIAKTTNEVEATRGVDRDGTIVQIKNDEKIRAGEQPFYVIYYHDKTGKLEIDKKTGKTKIIKTDWTGSSIKIMIPPDASSGNVILYRGTVKSNGTPFTFVSTGSQGQPEVFNMTPNRGKPGSYTTIEGKNFGQREGTATINYKKADGKIHSIRPEDIVKWQTDTIQIRVPQDAVTGFFEIVTAAGLSNFPTGFPTIVDEKNISSYFSVIRLPSVQALSPSNIVIGQQLIILGSDFGEFKGKVVAEGQTIKETDISAWNETTIVVNQFPLVAIPSSRDYGLLYIERADSSTADPLISNNFKFTIRSIIETSLSANIYPVTGVTGQFKLKLTGTASKGTPPYTYTFDYGDGNSDTVSNVTDTYASKEHDYKKESPRSGFTAKLLVRDAVGAISEAILSSPVKVVAADRPIVTSIELVREGGILQEYTFDFNDVSFNGGGDAPQQTGIYPLWNQTGTITHPKPNPANIYAKVKLAAREFKSPVMPWDLPNKGSVKLMTKFGLDDVAPTLYSSGYGAYTRNRDILGFYDVFDPGTADEVVKADGKTPAPFTWFGTWFQRVQGTQEPGKNATGLTAHFYSGESINIMTNEMNPADYFNSAAPNAYRVPGATLGRPLAHPGDRILIRGFNFGSEYTNGSITITPTGSTKVALTATGKDNYDDTEYNNADANGYFESDTHFDKLKIVRWEDNGRGASPTIDTGLYPVLTPGKDGYSNDNPNPNPTGEDYIEIIIPCVERMIETPTFAPTYLCNDSVLETRLSGKLQVNTTTKEGISDSNILFAPRVVSTYDGNKFGSTQALALDAKVPQTWTVSDIYPDLQFFQFGEDQNADLINYDTKTFIGVQPTFSQGGQNFVPWMRTYWITPSEIDLTKSTVTFDLSTLPKKDTIITNADISAGAWRIFIWSGARRTPPTNLKECNAGIVSFPIIRFFNP